MEATGRTLHAASVTGQSIKTLEEPDVVMALSIELVPPILWQRIVHPAAF
ncbi:conserved hypothetical protein [delta proteobacterium NaphS2]|nr:conserved hypothetical protein [delta proteobacterium NaphS2]